MNQKPMLLVLLGLASLMGWIASTKATAGTDQSVSYTLAQAQRGKRVYAEHCARCHGATMRGGAAPALTGSFWSAWEGRSVGELFVLTRNSMPADAAASLSDAEYTAILAYMLQTGGYPNGSAELPGTTDALSSRKVRPQR